MDNTNYRGYISSGEYDLVQMMEGFSKQTEGCEFKRECNSEEYESTRIVTENTSRYYLLKDGKIGLMLTLGESFLTDEFGITVRGGLTRVYLGLNNKDLEGLYSKLVELAKSKEYTDN